MIQNVLTGDFKCTQYCLKHNVSMLVLVGITMKMITHLRQL